MFTGVRRYNPPYKNDQHPFLIWNLYRFNADGSIEQIGRSGVKHAFVTINAGCLDSCNQFAHSLGRGCGDTYGSGNNDSPGDMGAALGNRAGHRHLGPLRLDLGFGLHGHTSTATATTRGRSACRSHESQIDPAANPGATYMMDSWYIAREDINIYNSMATITGTPHYASNQWSLRAAERTSSSAPRSTAG